jgi:signal transduction histidine kinase
MIDSNIHEGLETVLTLYYNKIKHTVEVRRQYGRIPPVACYPDELNQVWTNLIHNALQAMEYRGTLTIRTEAQDQDVAVSITDSGSGIPEDVRQRIFEPFFTTKPQGEGSGLGLDIARKIVEKHQGDIQVESRPGETTFSVKLPITGTP